MSIIYTDDEVIAKVKTTKVKMGLAIAVGAFGQLWLMNVLPKDFLVIIPLLLFGLGAGMAFWYAATLNLIKLQLKRRVKK